MSENAKIYQDATQGYIEVEDLYNEELVDTLYMQRERKVSQVGLQAVFMGASHDRFSHSLGVFGMGKKIYSSASHCAYTRLYRRVGTRTELSGPPSRIWVVEEIKTPK